MFMIRNVSTTAKISDLQALNIVLKDLKSKDYNHETLSKKLVIYFDKNTLKSYLAYKIKLSSFDPIGCFYYYVDALTGDIIFKRNFLMGSSVSGRVSVWVKPKYPNDSIVSNTLFNTFVTIDGTNTTTDINGVFKRTKSGNLIKINSSLSGPYFKIFDMKNFTITNFISNGTNNNIKWNFSTNDFVLMK